MVLSVVRWISSGLPAGACSRAGSNLPSWIVSDSETASSARAPRATSGAADAKRTTARICRRFNAPLQLLIPVKGGSLPVNDKPKDVNKQLGNSGLFVNLKAQF